jgi:cell division protein FtsI (penicillin-binding protein 3)
MKKKYKNNKKFNPNQKSFYFEDYLETNYKQKKISKSLISEDRVYILFFFFFCLMTIFAIKITFVSLQAPQFLEIKKNNLNFLSLRRDVVDRNGELISRNIKAYHAAVKPNLIKDKQKFLLNIKINFPEISQEKLKNNLSKNKWFYLKKRLTEEERNKFWLMGDKAIELESYQSRIYPHGNLYSHILGQIDDDNYGISGVESYFDRELKDLKKISRPLSLTLDTNIQYLIQNELEKATKDFSTNGAAGLLMSAKTGEVLSLVSLPNYNINLRKNINNDIFANKITKSQYELGSIFKTFTIALALDENLLEPESIVNDITKNIKCSKYVISDTHEFSSSMRVDEILIQSSNVGAVKIAEKVGEIKFRNFLNKLNLLNMSKIELDEVSTPKKLKWNKCKLETVSFGHGIMTTPIQAAAAYATISNGGYRIEPTLKKNIIKSPRKNKKIISSETSAKMNTMLRKVVTDKKGTASMANIFGYQVGGKTGTAQNYERKNENINTFISVFPIQDPNYVLLVLLDDPKAAPDIIYNYKGKNITNINRNEAGWNAVYVAGKIIKKIGPILAINNEEFHNKYVVKKSN